MKPLSLAEIAKAVDGQLSDLSLGSTMISDITIDSRWISPYQNVNTLFVPLHGTRDGHLFIENAFEDGAVACFCEYGYEIDYPCIKVENTLEAFKKLAKHYISLFDIKIIGITGSNGKTTTKDMIYSVLSKKFNVLKTIGNFNNDIGLPLTIFRIEDTHEIAVLEMGMNHMGEIRGLSQIAPPNIAVITNIGVAHIENLGSRENIFSAKSEILENLRPKGICFLNGDDDFLKQHAGRGDVRFYGNGENNTYRIKNLHLKGIYGSEYDFEEPEGDFKIKLSVPGAHMATNSAVAVAIGLHFEIKESDIYAALESFHPTGQRMQVTETGKGLFVIDDCYNANPESAKAALDVLANSNSERSIAILGDMFELGKDSEKMHYELGKYAASLGISHIICVGELASHIYEGAFNCLYDEIGAMSDTQCLYFEDKEAFKEQFELLIKTGDMVLVKASRGMRFEEIIRWMEA